VCRLAHQTFSTHRTEPGMGQVPSKYLRTESATLCPFSNPRNQLISVLN